MNSKAMKESRFEKFLENPKRSLWTLAIPVMVGMGIQNVYTIVDLLFIGQLGGNAIASVAFIMPMFFLVLGLTMGIGAGVTASIARYIGAKDKVSADNAAFHTLFIGLIISFLLVTPGLLYGRKILLFLGVDPTFLGLSWSYLRVICYGLPFMVFSSFFRSILAGEGDMRFPMIVAGTGTILNIIFDPIFIFTLGMGVKGAAVATILSQFIVFLIFIYMLIFKEHAYIQFKFRYFIPSKRIIYSILKVGVPASMSMIVMSAGQALFNRILVFYSSDAVAAYQVGGRVDMIILMPIIAIATAMTTIVGMFYGGSEFNNLYKFIRYGILRAIGITSILSVLIFLLAPVLANVFTDSVSIRAYTVQYLRFIVIVYPLIAIGITSGRILQGLGKGFPLLVITIIRIMGVSGPLALLFAFVLNKPIEWIWIAMMISTFVSATIALNWVRISFRKLGISQVVSD